MSNKSERIGKLLCFVLRHDPGAIGGTVDTEGWMAIDAIVPGHMSMAELVVAVGGDSKGRFEMSEHHIRCLYGHSIPSVNITKTEVAQVIPTLYHATTVKAMESIAVEGIKSQERNTVHLTSDRNTAFTVAMRYAKSADKVVVLKILNPQELEDLQCVTSEIWTCAYVPVTNFEKEINVSTI